MLKITLLILIFGFISEKTIDDIYGVDIPFDKDNTEFEFDYNGEGDNDILVVFVEINERARYNHTCGMSSVSMSLSPPGRSTSFLLQGTKVNNKLEIYNLPSNGKGNIWLNPLKNKLNIDLSEKKYGKMIYLIDKMNGEYYFSPLTFVIANAAKNVKFKFEYEKTSTHYKKYIEGDLLNPFRVCHRNDCIDDVSTYEFKKGESYEIRVKFQKVLNEPENIHILPGFSFYESNSSFLKINLIFVLFIAFLF